MVVTDANGRPLNFFMTASQISDYTGAAALPDSLPNKAQWLPGDRGYDADRFRVAPFLRGVAIEGSTIISCFILIFSGELVEPMRIELTTS